ncbi:hypothetical protein B0T18DRAFT_393628 [Schizothecium vesticola]|uniref:Uncharacterized protein n=1 Tax=Schizothecium vesticola TaxID=314040 RepID=A0AA40EKE0_9PEZI|nr:hypothetical protein B0T18DRAFT_393628 [Schizothecium vesticola]
MTGLEFWGARGARGGLGVAGTDRVRVAQQKEMDANAGLGGRLPAPFAASPGAQGALLSAPFPGSSPKTAKSTPPPTLGLICAQRCWHSSPLPPYRPVGHNMTENLLARLVSQACPLNTNTKDTVTNVNDASHTSERPATPTDPPGVPPPASPKHNRIRRVGSTSEGRERTPIGVVSQLPILPSITTGIHAMVSFGSPPRCTPS